MKKTLLVFFFLLLLLLLFCFVNSLSLASTVTPIETIWDGLGITGMAPRNTPSPRFKIAFVSDRDGQREIYTINDDGKDLVRLTNNNVSDDYPVWSPDATKIMYISKKKEIWIVGFDGSSPQCIVENYDPSSLPIWSPDSRKVLFTGKQKGNKDIYSVEIEDSKIIRLTDHRSSDYRPQWSPDGEKILFISKRDGSEEIYTMKVDGSAQQRLTKNKSRIVSIRWSPDCTKILYQLSYSSTGPKPGIYLMNADGSNPMFLMDSTNLKDISFSPSGKELAMTYSNGREVVMGNHRYTTPSQTIDLPFGEKKTIGGNVTNYEIKGYGYTLQELSLESGDTRVLFDFIMDTKGMSEKVVWTEHGFFITNNIINENTSRHLIRYTNGWGEKVLLVFQVYANNYYWSPDKKKAACMSVNKKKSIYIIEMDDDRFFYYRLADLGNNENPAWSPVPFFN